MVERITGFERVSIIAYHTIPIPLLKFSFRKVYNVYYYCTKCCGHIIYLTFIQVRSWLINEIGVRKSH